MPGAMRRSRSSDVRQARGSGQWPSAFRRMCIASFAIVLSVVLASKYLFPRSEELPDTSPMRSRIAENEVRTKKAAAERQILPKRQWEAGMTGYCSFTRTYRSTGSWRLYRDTSGRYGSPCIRAELGAQCRGVSRNRIEQLMRRHGSRGRRGRARVAKFQLLGHLVKGAK